MSSKHSDQLVLDLSHRAATGREDFLVSGANKAAVTAVDAWPQWPSSVLVLVGPPGSGKSHLCDVWRTASGASVVRASELTRTCVPTLMAAGAVVIEDAPGEGLDEVALFHLFNLARETSGHVLMTSNDFPSHWAIDLPDLKSRLKAAQVAPLGDPDDDLLRGVLVKQFNDRQLRVDGSMISFMISRMERSFDAARQLVAEIDRRALVQKVEITRNFISRILQEQSSPELFADD